MLDVFRTADHAVQIFIPHRLAAKPYFRGRLASLAQIAAGGRLSRRLGGLLLSLNLTLTANLEVHDSRLSVALTPKAYSLIHSPI